MASDIQKREISSLDEMKSFLNGLQRNSSLSVREVISAQLAVIQFVQSPTLSDTMLDTLIYGLQKSLKYSASEQEKESLRERFAFMIQNYIFFLDAQVQYEVNQHRENAYVLLRQAGEMLSRSVFEVALCAASQGDMEKMGTLIVKNVFAQNNKEKTESFFKRFAKWFTNRYRVEDAKANFYNTLAITFRKIDEYHELLGNSIIIKGMIDRYADDIASYAYESEVSSIQREASSYDPPSFWWICALGLLSIAIRALWNLISSIWSDGNFNWFLTHLFCIIGATIVYLFVVRVVYFVRFTIPLWNFKRNEAKLSKKLHKIANMFKE